MSTKVHVFEKKINDIGQPGCFFYSKGALLGFGRPNCPGGVIM